MGDEPDARPVRLLTVCGSLQARSANRAALDVAAEAAIQAGATVVDFDGLALLPAFDAARSDEPPAAVAAWRRAIEDADGLVVAVPEYAGGMAGATKNALDWLVTSASLYRRPIAVISAGTSGGTHALAQSARTMTWQGAYVVGVLGIAAPITKSDEEGRLTDEATLGSLRALVDDLLVAARPGGLPAAAAMADRVTAGLGIEPGHVVGPA
jgi:NAD(P)H-dependent FMN reductase